MYYSGKFSGAFSKSNGAKIVMPLKSYLSFAFLSVCLFFACGPSREEMEFRENAKAISDSVSDYVGGLSNDTVDGVLHNFERTANLKCKVNNVLDVSSEIENIVSENGGYVAESNLNSEITYSQTIRTKEDSITNVLRYVTTNKIELRVPKRRLDTVLRKISKMALYIDYRHLKTEDVKLKLYANQLKEERYQNFANTSQKQIDNSQSRIDKINVVQENVLAKKVLADETRIESYEMADKVNFSKVFVQLYQQETESKITSILSAALKVYEPTFFNKVFSALSNGFEVIKQMILFIVESWGLIFILFITLIGGLKIYNKLKRLNIIKNN